MIRVVTCDGEIQAKAIDEVHEKLKVVEDQWVKELFPESGSPTIESENLGFLDILICSIFYPLQSLWGGPWSENFRPRKQPVGVVVGENLERAALGDRAIPPSW